MNVTELLKRIQGAYPGATSEALATFVPVFHARLKHREGAPLEDAATEVFASFKAKYDQKFPIPADFEKFMPSIHGGTSPSGGASIRGEMEAREQRRKRVLADWKAGQGAKIRAARPKQVYDACERLAFTMCGRCGDRLIFTAQQIDECEGRALSQSRLAMFGKLPADNETWSAQIEQVRQAWANPERAAA